MGEAAFFLVPGRAKTAQSLLEAGDGDPSQQARQLTRFWGAGGNGVSDGEVPGRELLVCQVHPPPRRPLSRAKLSKQGQPTVS